MNNGEGFLSRWSRRKRGLDPTEPRRDADPRVAVVPPNATATPVVGGAPVAGSGAEIPALGGAESAQAPSSAVAPGATQPAGAQPLPSLDDVAKLTRDSDYAPFVNRQVEPEVRNAAMKKLFSDPHFNVMDGLDTYIDDYNKPDPLPASMLRKMVSARALGLFSDEDAAAAKAKAQTDASSVLGQAESNPGEVATAQATPDGAQAPALAQSDSDESQAPHEDPDLRLQPDDAAGPAGPGECARPAAL